MKIVSRTGFVPVVCLLWFSLLVPAVGGQNRKACTTGQAQQALDEADQLKDWNELHRSFTRFAQCDDGAIAEGYSDTVVRLLANNWASIGILSKLTKTDKKFESFVLRYIDATADASQLEAIATDARKNCPTAEAALCRKILRSATDAR